MKRRRAGRTGGVLIWKPVGISSRGALEVAERALDAGPLGHTGTLDPLAEGLLLLLGGEARKFQALLTDHDKSYRAEVTLGIVSESEDAEGPLYCPVPRPELPARSQIVSALGRFVGGYDQTPPQHSAVHVDGERAWKRARRGEQVVMEVRAVRIERVELIECDPPTCRLEIECGPGTYIRSLVRDLGEDLGCGAYLSGLARTGLGSFRGSEAVALETITPAAWLSLETLLAPIPRLDVPPDLRERLAVGQRVPLPEPREERPEPGVRVIWSEGVVVGLGEVRGGIIQPKRWLRGR